MPHIDIEEINGYGGFYLYLYPLGDLVQRHFCISFYMSIIKGTFLKNFIHCKLITCCGWNMNIHGWNSSIMMMETVMTLAIMLMMMLTMSSMTTSHIFFVVVSIAKFHIETFQVSNIEIPSWLFTLKVKFLLILFFWQVTCEGEAWSLRSSHRKIKGKQLGST